MSPIPSRWPCRGLYAVTPDSADTAALCAMANAALRGGAVLLQYRNKSADATLRREQARALLPICRRHGVALLVNDEPALAAEVGADGVHLGRNDGSPAEARDLLGPDAIIGVSCYDDLGLAERAARDGASYVAFGAFFPSPTKPGAVRADIGLLAATARIGLPRVAIGGIRADNALALIDAGADLLAVITGVFDAPDIEAAARSYSRLFPD